MGKKKKEKRKVFFQVLGHLYSIFFQTNASKRYRERTGVGTQRKEKGGDKKEREEGGGKSNKQKAKIG